VTAEALDGLTLEDAKKSKAGRKPIEAIMTFLMLILQSLYNLSDEQVEYQPDVVHAIPQADASVHDSQKLDGLPNTANTCRGVRRQRLSLG
jgi:hypothetical protein